MPLPYETKDRNAVKKMKRKLAKTYPGIGERRARQFMHVVNSEYEKTGDKSRAYAGAHATIQRNGAVKESIDEEYFERLLSSVIVEATQTNQKINVVGMYGALRNKIKEGIFVRASKTLIVINVDNKDVKFYRKNGFSMSSLGMAAWLDELKIVDLDDANRIADDYLDNK